MASSGCGGGGGGGGVFKGTSLLTFGLGGHSGASTLCVTSMSNVLIGTFGK